MAAHGQILFHKATCVRMSRRVAQSHDNLLGSEDEISDKEISTPKLEKPRSKTKKVLVESEESSSCE